MPVSENWPVFFLFSLCFKRSCCGSFRNKKIESPQLPLKKTTNKMIKAI